MKKKNFFKLLLILILIIFTWFVYSNYFKKNIKLILKQHILQRQQILQR